MTDDLRSAHRLDALFATVLALATSLFVVWQNSRLAILWDLSYILENASRIAIGQVPYRDFVMPYPPLTFAAQALILRLFGRAIWHHAAWATVGGGAATALAFVLVRRIAPSRPIALAFTAPLVVLGIYSIVPHPFYDPDCCLAVLAVLVALVQARRSAALFATGALAVVPLFIKQNIGLAFLAGIVFVALVHRLWPLAAGVVAGLVTALAIVAAWCGIPDYLRWTIRFAAERRLPPLAQQLTIYRDPTLWWWLAVVVAGTLLARRSRMAGMALALIPFAWIVLRFGISDDPVEREVNLLRIWPLMIVCGTIAALLQLLRARSKPVPRALVLAPIPAIAAINGALLSQNVWGSTYGIWPLLAVLLALWFRETIAAFVVGATMLACGIPYVVHSERLTYVKLDGPLRTSALPSLRGLHVSGSWLPEFEELIQWTDRNIPAEDGILCLPGEDLFWFATRRRPALPVVMFDRTVSPYDAATIVRLARERKIRWLIVKLRLQLNGVPMESEGEVLRLVAPYLDKRATLTNYAVYSLRWSEEPGLSR
jgi:hypothetical protein